MPPLLVTHGLQCDVTFAARLSKALPSEQPVYAYSAVGLDGQESPIESLGAMAARYVREAAVVPMQEGVILVGFCAGGHVSLRMAPILADAGVKVRRVFLIDTPRKMLPGQFELLAEQQVAIAAHRLILRPELRRHFGGGAATVRAYTNALLREEAIRYEGDTTLLIARETVPIALDKNLGWPGWLPELTPVKVIAETREELLGPGLSKIAAIIAKFSGICAPVKAGGEVDEQDV